MLFAFQSQYFSSDSAYFHVKHIEHIRDTGKPMLYDSLSYGGKSVLYPPLFHYILAFLSLFIPLVIVLKIIPALMLGLLAVIVYLLGIELTQDYRAAFFSATLTAFIPLLVSRTLNQVSVYTFILPLFFFMIYCFLKIKEKKSYLWYFIGLSLLFPFLHPNAFLFVLVLLFYVALLVSEGFTLSKIHKEALVFSALLIILLEFFFYRSALLEHGFGVLQGGIPAQFLPSVFQSVNVLEIFYHVGVATIVLGSFGVYSLLFRKREKHALLLVSVVLSTLLLLLFKLLDFFGGLLFLGVTLGVLSSIAFAHLFKYVSITKLAKYQSYLLLIFFVVVLVFSFLPSYYLANQVVTQSISDDEVISLLWIRDHTPKESVVLADVDEGNYINAIAQRKNIADISFLLAPDALVRLEDIKIMYLTFSEARALSLFRKYHVNYIYVSKETKQKYSFTKLIYTTNAQCFKKVQAYGTTEIYQILCST